MALVGNLKDIKLPTLVQINCIERNTAKLTIEHLGRYGFIYFDNGQVVHAEYEPFIGEEAFFKLLELYSGNFKVENGVRAPAITIKKNWNNLLLEGLHRRDTAVPESKYNFTRLFENLLSIKGVNHTLIVNRSGQIIAQSGQQDGEVIDILFQWYEAQKLSQILGQTKLRFLQQNLGSSRKILIGLEEDLILVISLTKKVQQELIFSVVRENLKISI